MTCWQDITQVGLPASLGYSTPISETPLEEAKTLAKGKLKMLEQQEEEEIVKNKKGTTKANGRTTHDLTIVLRNSSNTLSSQWPNESWTAPTCKQHNHPSGWPSTHLDFHKHLWLMDPCGVAAATQNVPSLPHLEKELLKAQISKMAIFLSNSAAKLA